MSTRLLITGINGFVGSNIYDEFSSHMEICGVDLGKDETKTSCSYFSWDDLDSIPNVDAIVHLAGIAHDVEGTNDDAKYFEINVGLTKLILDHFIRSTAKNFIFFSSVKAAADTVNAGPLTENNCPAPKTPYGKSKLEAEEYILSIPLPTGKSIYLLRPAMIHGPGNKGNLNLLYSIIRSGIPYPLGAYSNERSFTSIKNVLFILDALLHQDIPSGIYNVCDDNPLATLDVVSIIYSSLERKEKIWNVPKSLIEMLAKAGDLFHLPFTSERLKKLTESYTVSNKKIKRELNIESLPTDAREGLLSTLQSFNK